MPNSTRSGSCLAIDNIARPVRPASCNVCSCWSCLPAQTHAFLAGHVTMHHTRAALTLPACLFTFLPCLHTCLSACLPARPCRSSTLTTTQWPLRSGAWVPWGQGRSWRSCRTQWSPRRAGTALPLHRCLLARLQVGRAALSCLDRHSFERVPCLLTGPYCRYPMLASGRHVMAGWLAALLACLEHRT